MTRITGRDDEFRATITAVYRQRLGRDPEPAGMVSWLEHLRNGMTGDELDRAVAQSPEGIAYASRPPQPAVVDLGVSGADFIDRATGVRVVLNGTDQFCALRQAFDGVDLEPLIIESQALGFGVWRIFCQGSIRQNGVLDLNPATIGPSYYTILEMVGHLLNGEGILPLWTVFVDNQDIALGDAHWLAVCEAVSSHRCLVSGGNEWSKNGFSPSRLPIPAERVFWSRGSDVGEQPPATPAATFIEYHPRRDYPKVLDDTIASATYLRFAKGYTVPLLVDEPPRMGTDGSSLGFADPQVCWQLGRGYSVACAGAIFHSRAGQRGTVMDEQTHRCAEAWTAGITL